MIRIITDTASDLSVEEAKKINVTLLPMTITFDDKSYLDRFELSTDEFYDLLSKSKDLPRTSQINPACFEEEFKKAKDAGDDVIAITMSGELSGTYQSACIAASEFDNVYVIDTKEVSVGVQCVVRYALSLVEKGFDAKKIYEILCEDVPRVKIVALLDTLDYLKKGGRISPTVAFAGSILSIKPAVTVIDGKVEIIGKARGSKNGNNFLIQTINNSGGIDFSKPVLLAYSGTDRTLLDQYIKDSHSLWEDNIKEEDLKIFNIGSTVGTHVGPGAIAVAFFPLDK